MKRTKWYIAAIMLFAATIIVAGCKKEKDEITEEQARIVMENAEVVMDNVSQIYEASETVEEMAQHLDEIKAMANVEDAYRDDIAICVKIKDGGIIMWCYYVEEYEEKNILHDSILTNVMNVFPQNKDGVVCGNNSVCILDPLSDSYVFGMNILFNVMENEFRELNYNVCRKKGRNVTLEFLKNEMSDYGVIIVNTHGCYSGGLHWLETGVKRVRTMVAKDQTDDFIDWKKDNIRYSQSEKAGKGYGDIYTVTVCENFFKEYISKSFVDNSLMYINACQTFKGSNNMWLTLRDKGLGCMIGYSTNVNWFEARENMSSFMSSMFSGFTASDAWRVINDDNLNCYPENSDIILVEKEPVGDDWVDLGLPSGLLWATRNVGATSPEDYGDYFAWGETTPKSVYSGITYIYSRDYDQLTKYCNNSDYGYNGFTDNLTILQPGDDAATANYGGRTPTKEEWEELINNTTVTWTTQNGVNGRLFTGTNGNSLFLPAAGFREYFSLDDAGSYGYYWSSSLHTDDPDGAWCFDFDSGYQGMNGSLRYCGLSVRAVRSAR